MSLAKAESYKNFIVWGIFSQVQRQLIPVKLHRKNSLL